jgi:flagellar hook-length control protein FliK
MAIAQRSGKVEVARGAKAVEAPEGRTETPPTPTQNSAAKSAQAPAVSKESTATATPAAVESIDAPAPPAQQTTNALAQPTAQMQHATSVEQANAARAAPAAAQVAREIVRRFDGETTRFELRLDPPELGRVEVRLDVSRDHRVTAVIAADSPQALTELARHARDLEQMLQSSGLELADNGLSFDLRQGSEGSAEAETSDVSARAAAANEDAPQQQAPAARPLGYERWRGVRVDMMV